MPEELLEAMDIDRPPGRPGIPCQGRVDRRELWTENEEFREGGLGVHGVVVNNTNADILKRLQHRKKDAVGIISRHHRL